MVNYTKLVATTALAALTQVQADSSVYIRSHPQLTPATDASSTLSESDLSFLLARLTHVDSPLESAPPSGLPAADLFNTPSGTVALVVTDSTSTPSSPFTADSTSSVLTLDATAPSTADAVHAMLTGRTYKSEDNKVLQPDLCISADARACVNAASTVSVPASNWDSDFLGLVGLSLNNDGTSATHTSGVTVDLSDMATAQLVSELSLCYTTAADASNYQFVLMAVSGAEKVKAVHGSDSDEATAADIIVAAATPKILDAWQAAYNQDVFEVAVVRENGQGKRVAPRRVLSSSSASAYNYSSEETSDYQIFTWTWFLMLLVVFFAACSLGGVDIGKDDAGLYSTFKAGSYDRQTHDHSQ